MTDNLAALILALVGVGIGWIGFMWGWGLEPKSWFWIVACTFGGAACVVLAKAIKE